jgi:hypothetical protein
MKIADNMSESEFFRNNEQVTEGVALSEIAVEEHVPDIITQV